MAEPGRPDRRLSGRLTPCALPSSAISTASPPPSADPEQVQAAGGNTSLKADGVLWVKASGLWLADALTRDIFVPVRLGQVLEGIAGGDGRPGERRPW